MGYGGLPDAEGALGAVAAGVEPDLDTWSLASIESALRAMLDEEELNARKGLQPIRVAVSGSNVSPPLFESLVALGRSTVLERIRGAIERMDDSG